MELPKETIVNIDFQKHYLIHGYLARLILKIQLQLASRLWIDAIIDPLETRKIISMGIEAANNAPIKEAYNPGVIKS